MNLPGMLFTEFSHRLRPSESAPMNSAGRLRRHTSLRRLVLTGGCWLATFLVGAAFARAAFTPPPTNAIVLFNGQDIAQWLGNGGSAAPWNVTNGLLTVVPGTGGLRTWQAFEDFQLHLEFRFLTNSPAGTAEGQLHNSGVFLQGQFEIQIMEAFGRTPPATHACGAVYSIQPPSANVSVPNGQWEAYDITFRAARWINGVKSENARVTLYWNDVLVQNNFEITRPTASGAPPETPPPGPITLQDLDGPVQFRNIWLVPLTQPRAPGPDSITLVPAGSAWRYLDDGSDQGTGWRAPAFNHSTWSNGVAQFGYGDNDEVTLVRSNRLNGTRIETTYFRKSFAITDTWALTNLTLGLLRDDGAVAYLNGVEIFRSNITNTSITFTNWALVAAAGEDETRFFTTNVNPALLVEGTNCLAIEVHQSSATSSDFSFDARLTALAWHAPRIGSERVGGSLVLTWPTAPSGFALEATTSLTNASWTAVTNATLVASNGFTRVTLPLDPAARFFRMKRAQ